MSARNRALSFLAVLAISRVSLAFSQDLTQSITTLDEQSLPEIAIGISDGEVSFRTPDPFLADLYSSGQGTAVIGNDEADSSEIPEETATRDSSSSCGGDDERDPRENTIYRDDDAAKWHKALKEGTEYFDKILGDLSFVSPINVTKDSWLKFIRCHSGLSTLEKAKVDLIFALWPIIEGTSTNEIIKDCSLITPEKAKEIAASCIAAVDKLVNSKKGDTEKEKGIRRTHYALHCAHLYASQLAFSQEKVCRHHATTFVAIAKEIFGKGSWYGSPKFEVGVGEMHAWVEVTLEFEYQGVLTAGVEYSKKGKYMIDINDNPSALNPFPLTQADWDLWNNRLYSLMPPAPAVPPAPILTAP